MLQVTFGEKLVPSSDRSLGARGLSQASGRGAPAAPAHRWAWGTPRGPCGARRGEGGAGLLPGPCGLAPDPRTGPVQRSFHSRPWGQLGPRGGLAQAPPRLLSQRLSPETEVFTLPSLLGRNNPAPLEMALATDMREAMMGRTPQPTRFTPKGRSGRSEPQQASPSLRAGPYHPLPSELVT